MDCIDNAATGRPLSAIWLRRRGCRCSKYLKMAVKENRKLLVKKSYSYRDGCFFVLLSFPIFFSSSLSLCCHNYLVLFCNLLKDHPVAAQNSISQLNHNNWRWLPIYVYRTHSFYSIFCARTCVTVFYWFQTCKGLYIM